MHEKKNYTLWILLLLPFLLCAQPKWEGILFVGGANYQGDLVPTVHPYPAETNLAFGGHLRYNFSKQWAMRLGATYGQLSGDDANFDAINFSQERRFRFTSQIMEGSLLLEWEPFGSWRYRDSVGFKRLFSPYLFAGGALAISNPKTTYADFKNGESPAEVKQDRAAPYPEQLFAAPFGVGIKWDLSQRTVLGVEGGTRYVTSDYLDGVSQSGNPKEPDWYAFAGVTLTFRFFKKDADSDGVPDKDDRCPKIAGSPTARGCPDGDGDGVENSEDLCPEQAGVKILGGCPDSDTDGLADQEDRCPNAAGPGCTNGCPDGDEDCVTDSLDACPDECGVAYANGCADTDGDRIIDREDWCALLAGLPWKGGCPLMDTDGDGIVDEKHFSTTNQTQAEMFAKIGQKIEVPHTALRLVRRGLITSNGIIMK